MEQKLVKTQIMTLMERAFFGKNNCAKVALNSERDCYLHIGKQEIAWRWNKTKLSDLELAEIISVIDRKKTQVSFFHKYNGKSTQIWINGSKDFMTIKIMDLSKSFSFAEQQVLKILLTRIIWIMNTR